MNQRPIKVIKPQKIEKLEENIIADNISLVYNLFRWLCQKKPEKAKEVLQKLEAELC